MKGKILEVISKKSFRQTLFILLLFLTFYLILFFPIITGIGNYWDWVFPYFNEHLKNYFLNDYVSWNSINFGSPMSYSSDYFFRFIISGFSYLPLNPETVLYFYLTFIFSIGSFGVYLICMRKTRSKLLSILISLAVFISPALFYDLLGGFVNYFLSFVIFIYLYYFLFYFYKKDLKSTIILALLFSFIGAQIQFFVISAILLIIYFIINKEKFDLRYLFIFIIIVLLINFVWLSNFLVGANNVQSVSLKAEKVAFMDNSQQKIINIFSLSFSKATQIYRFYDLKYQIFFLFLFILVLALTISKKMDKDNLVTLIFLAINIGLSTGYFTKFDLGPINVFYPLFRQVGHFSSVILFSLMMLIPTIKFNKFMKEIVIITLFVFLLINIPIYYSNYPLINFGNARDNFEDFNNFNTQDNTNYRILYYPFFYQYSFTNSPRENLSSFLIMNSGYDSFSRYSGEEYVNSYVPHYLFNQSIQYKFIKSDYSVEELRNYNIKYIYDFSDFYESNYERYVPSTTYENNLSLIKNDPKFIEKVLERNSDVSLVRPKIIQIKDFLPRVYSDNYFFEKINPTKYQLYTKNLNEPQKLSFLESYNKGWKLYLVKHPSNDWCNQIEFYENTNTTECEYTQKFFEGEELSYLWKKPVFDESHEMVYDYANGWTIEPEYIKSHYSSDYYTVNPDGSIDVEFVMYFKPQSYFYIGLLISITTLIVCLAYLFYSLKTRKQKALKTPQF